MKRYRVIKKYQTEFKNPISVEIGEKVICIEESDPNGDWANWILCKTIDNKGWIPKQLIDCSDNECTITETYCAKEFNLEIGEILSSEKELNGWIWCFKDNSDDLYAWAPLNYIELME